MWNLFAERLNDTGCHKFRTPTDINQQIFTAHEIVWGDYIPMNRYYYGVVYPMLSKSYKECANNVRTQCYRMTCVNDAPDITAENFEAIRNHIIAAFEEVLPHKCCFEK